MSHSQHTYRHTHFPSSGQTSPNSLCNMVVYRAFFNLLAYYTFITIYQPLSENNTCKLNTVIFLDLKILFQPNLSLSSHQFVVFVLVAVAASFWPQSQPPPFPLYKLLNLHFPIVHFCHQLNVTPTLVLFHCFKSFIL